MKFTVRPLHLFAAAALIGFVILLTGESDDPVIWRYSTRYVAVLAGYSAAVVVGVFILSRRLPTLPAGVWWLIGTALAGIAAWLPLLDHTPYLNLTLKLVLITFGLALIKAANPRFIYWRAAALLYLTLILATSVLTITAYPLMHISDEGWTANVGQTFVAEGVVHSRIHQGIFGVPQRFVPLGNVLPGYWFEAAGSGLFQARLISFFGGLLLLALTFTIARQMGFGDDASLLAVCALASSYPFWLTSHFFRLDVYLALVGMTALYCYGRSHRGSAWAFIAGLLLSLGVELHQNALVLCTAAGGLMIFGVIARSIRLRHLSLKPPEVYFVIGGVCGAGLFLALHVLPDPELFMRQFRNGGSWRAELTSASLGGIFRVLVEMVSKFWQASPLGLIVCGTALISATFNPKARLGLTLSALILLALNFLLPSYLEYYAILIMPLLALLVGMELRRHFGDNYALSLVVCAAMVLPLQFTAIQDRREGVNDRLLRAFEEVSTVFKADARIAAPQIFVFAMPHNPNLIALFMPRYAQWTRQPFNGVDVWQKYQPEAFIVYGIYGAEEDPAAETYRQLHGFQEVIRINDLPQPLIVYALPTALKAP